MKNPKFISALFLLLALLLIFPAAGALAQSPADWVVQYYNNPDLAGNPVATVHESAIDHNWGSGSPLNVVPPDNFSARWTATVNFDNAAYIFSASADDGVRLWIDGELLIDSWKEGSGSYTAEKSLSGPHIVQLAYFECRGQALVKLSWQKKAETPLYPGYAVTWLSQYYGNRNLEGSPITTIKEPGIDYDWGFAAPMNGVPADNFSIRWTGEPDFEAASYTFNVTVDDGVRLWIDGALVIDEWRVQSKTTYTYRAKMTAGKHIIQMAYFEATGQAVAKLHWAKGDLPGEPLPGGDSSAIWETEYFSNHTLTAPAAKTRTETYINYDWAAGSPMEGIPADYFSVRWTANVSFTEGDYTFFATADDGIRAWIDGKLIIDQWKEQSATTFSAKVHLGGGPHRIQVIHYEATGDAVAKFWWQPGFSGGVNPPPAHGCNPPHHQRPECGGNYPPPGGERLVIDNLDPGFSWGGPAEYKNASPGGYGTGFFWTKNSADEPVNYAQWTPAFRTGGRYEVFVFIPATCATTQNLRYRIMHNGERHDVQISQARYGNQWVSLGVYAFNGRGAESVIAYDNTGEPDASRFIAFDAVKFEAR